MVGDEVNRAKPDFMSYTELISEETWNAYAAGLRSKGSTGWAQLMSTSSAVLFCRDGPGVMAELNKQAGPKARLHDLEQELLRT